MGLGGKECVFSIIGASQRSFRYLKIMQKLQIPVSGIYSSNPQKAQDMIEQLGMKNTVTVYDSLANMWEHDESTAAFIATPIETHANYALEALYHGRNVLLSNLIARNIRELASIQMALNSENLFLMEANSVLFSPTLELISKHIRESQPILDKIGTISSITVYLGRLKRNDSEKVFFDENEPQSVNYRTIGEAALAAIVSIIGTDINILSTTPTHNRGKNSSLEGVTLFKNDFNINAVINVSDHSIMPDDILITGSLGYIHIKGFTSGLSFLIYNENREVETYCIRDKVCEEYNLLSEDFVEDRELCAAVMLTKFRQMFVEDPCIVKSQNLSRYSESLTIIRLLSEILA